jgi:hypothetical protein
MGFVKIRYCFCDHRTCSAESIPSSSENEKFLLLFSPFTRGKATVTRLDPTTGIAT